MTVGGLTPRAAAIVAAARAILEADGPEALTMRRVADALGIRAPSLYKHLADKQALEAAIISDLFDELADAFAAARPTAGGDLLGAFARVYRDFARRNPHGYRLATVGRLPRDLLRAGAEERAGTAVFEATGRDVDRARAAWAFAHGMAILEIDDRFPPGADIDAAWRAGVGAFRPPAA